MDTAFLNTASEQTFASSDFNIKQETFDGDNNASLLAWSQQYQPQQHQQERNNNNFIDTLGSAELDVSSLVNQSIWPIEQQDTSLNNLFAPWNSNVQVPPTIKEEWTSNNNMQEIQQQQMMTPISYQSQAQQTFMFPSTPPVRTPNTYNTNVINNKPMSSFNDISIYPSFQQSSREITPPTSISASASGSNSPNSSVSTPPPSTTMSYYLSHLGQQQPAPAAITTTKTPRGPSRRKSTESHNTTTPARTYRRRASSHPSVASVVSLSAHEPVAHIIDGIEYITFLYSHDRLVKEYTVRTDVQHVNLEEIPAGFCVQNAIYPRANVARHEYDGNRWEYETSCNKLGWELCWLNQEQLCGRRGLIQRAVDSYRNRHAEMRSRRVTRQEKVANGTLRKRRAKKANSAIL